MFGTIVNYNELHTSNNIDVTTYTLLTVLTPSDMTGCDFTPAVHLPPVLDEVKDLLLLVIVTAIATYKFIILQRDR